MKIIGHGGAKGLAPENSLAGFDIAIQNKVDAIEFDTRTTNDGHVVLAHNATVYDTNGALHTVATTTLIQLQQALPQIVTLPDALSYINKKIPVIVEIKPGVNPAPIIAVIKECIAKGWDVSSISVASYSQSVLLEVHAALPLVKMIVVENWSSWTARRRAKQLNTKTIYMYECWLWPGFIAAFTKGGYELYAFPPVTARKERIFGYFGLSGACNKPAKAKRWARYGLTGVITDYPDRFKQA